TGAAVEAPAMALLIGPALGTMIPCPRADVPNPTQIRIPSQIRGVEFRISDDLLAEPRHLSRQSESGPPGRITIVSVRRVRPFRTSGDKEVVGRIGRARLRPSRAPRPARRFTAHHPNAAELSRSTGGGARAACRAPRHRVASRGSGRASGPPAAGRASRT